MFRRSIQPVHGFTLVEILVVIMIIGIASAMIIPQIGSRDDLVVSAAARVVMSDLIYAQNRAIALQKPHYVRFDGQQYTVSDATSMAAITNPVSQNPYTVTFQAAGTSTANVTLGSWGLGGQNTIGFDEMGSPFSFDGAATASLTSSGTISIHSINDTATLTIAVEPFTGEISVN